MAENNKQPTREHVVTSIDLPNGIVTFTKDAVNDITMIQPEVIRIPVQTIMILAAQITLAMSGIQPGGAAKVTQDGARPASGLTLEPGGEKPH